VNKLDINLADERSSTNTILYKLYFYLIRVTYKANLRRVFYRNENESFCYFKDGTIFFIEYYY